MTQSKSSSPLARVLCAAGLLLVACQVTEAAEPRADAGTGVDSQPQPLPQTPAELFKVDRVWTIHLTFTSTQWEAMEPRRRGGGRGGPAGFGPGMFLAPAFLGMGDHDHDGKLSKGEFTALGDKWFTQWDKDKTGKVDTEQLRAGLNASFAPPPGGPGGPPGPGGPGRMGGPGGPGGPRGGGMSLQGQEGKRNGLASVAGIDFDHVHADLDFEGTPLKDVAVRYKGNGTFMQSQGSLKRSLKIDLNRFEKGRTLAGVTTLNLHNNVTDASWMNEVLSHRLFRDAGVPASQTAYARVYVSVPDKFDRQYIGLYSVVENVDRNFAKNHFGTDEGALFKPVGSNLFDDLGDDWIKYNQTYDPKTKLTDGQKRRMIEFCKLVAGADDAEFAAKFGDFVDVDEFSRFMAVTVWLSTLDSVLTIGQNLYVYLDPGTNRFQFMPWDLDHSFGQFGIGASQEQRENLSINKPWRGNVRLLERAFKVDSFRKAYLARLEEFSGTIFTPERHCRQVEE